MGGTQDRPLRKTGEIATFLNSLFGGVSNTFFLLMKIQKTEEIKFYHNATGNYSTTTNVVTRYVQPKTTQIRKRFLFLNYKFICTRRINVGGIVIEYEGEDTGIGVLFASKVGFKCRQTTVKLPFYF